MRFIEQIETDGVFQCTCCLEQCYVDQLRIGWWDRTKQGLSISYYAVCWPCVEILGGADSERAAELESRICFHIVLHEAHEL